MKKFVLSIMAIFLGMTLTACRMDKIEEDLEAMDDKTEQRIVVYDANDKEVLVTENVATIDRFAEYLSQENVTEDEAVTIFEKVKDDAKRMYRYEVKLDDVPRANFYMYENYDMMTIKDLPVVGDLNIPLTAEDAEWFRHPEKWE